MFSFDNIKNFATSVIHGRNDYSPSVKDILHHVGNEVIQYMEVQRNPLNRLLQGTLDILTNNPYDKLYHLKLIIHTKTNIISLEKEEVITMRMNPKPHDFAESRKVPITHSITINQLLINTQHRMGDDFFKYNASHNNCQDFIRNILEANHLGYPELFDFISQNTAQLFDNLPNVRKFANTVTDIAGRFNVIKEGGTISNDNGLSNVEISKILKDKKDFMGVYSKDKLPKDLKNGWYVVNMENYNDGPGTHWVCFKSGSPFIYFDPYGISPPTDIMQVIPKKLYYNTSQIQDLDSTACGWFCIALILSDKHKKKPIQVMTDFLGRFTMDTKNNDKKLYLILKDLGVDV